MVRVLVFGTGSIGIVYSMILTRSGVDLSCICRSNYIAAKANGFTVHSTIFSSETFYPKLYPSVQNVSNSEEAPYDYILVTTKAFPRQTTDGSVPALIAPLVSLSTTIVLIQNGIGIERQYSERFPHNPIISCVAYLPTTQTAPGVVHHTEVERLQLGTFPAGGVPESHHHAAVKLAALMKTGGATVEVYPDVQVARWRKLIGNASWNTICALSRCRDLEFLKASPVATNMVRSVMEEVVDVAVAAGYGSEIGLEDVAMQMDRSSAREWPGVEPSMLADVRSNKPMEVDAIVGELVYLGREHGVSIPRLECLYALSSGLSWSQRETNSQ
ncbi:ketopantoate reductase PanE/ApbA C terminal-domain-containing protein [Aspergillus caelatus]|uniref:2-dehydropantoate 2-reductase n=1 Tax=Aspergillus caelatus TaxID=61420 RepID=A0A5N6ZTN8_9EURO|nr:ketopantoate reductase PanE/ApbA C terminal-domain-containing protein [Aspergillus caelatus]KAE8360768.1 ketopantoate reductase PanE/ApbA C terminal-domain-containing protein [Aspergillus caelatus]